MLPSTVPPWAGRTPRDWQAKALPIALDALRRRENAIICAIMGSGKSVLIAEVCASGRGRVVVTVPTVALVVQLAATIGARCPGEVGTFYGESKQTDKRITIVCLASLGTYAAATAHLERPALWIADEAHKTEAERVLEAHSKLQPMRSLGFTATPFRSVPTQELSLWSRLVYEYGVRDAMADGVVVPYRLQHWTGGEVTVDEACLQMVASSHGAGLVNALSVDDAEQYAAFLCRNGVQAKAVHSRLDHAAVSERIEMLKSGKLQCIVHVNMLAEGVDMPWLRWLCMRRAVKSTVRFCQEVGRVLRAYPGKTEAVLYDPNDLFDAMGLTYEAVLQGQAAPKGLDSIRAELDALAGAIDADAVDTPERWAKCLTVWRRYLRLLVHACIASGKVDQKIISRGWRSADPSARQIETASKFLRGLKSDTSVPAGHRRHLVTIADNVNRLTRGDVSDLFSVLAALKTARVLNEPLWHKLAAAIDGAEVTYEAA